MANCRCLSHCSIHCLNRCLSQCQHPSLFNEGVIGAGPTTGRVRRRVSDSKLKLEILRALRPVCCCMCATITSPVRPGFTQTAQFPPKGQMAPRLALSEPFLGGGYYDHSPRRNDLLQAEVVAEGEACGSGRIREDICQKLSGCICTHIYIYIYIFM